MKKRKFGSAIERPERRPDSNQHFRDLQSFVFNDERCPPLEFREFVHTKIVPLLSLEGNKIGQKEAITVHAIHRLVATWFVNACVADKRNTHIPGVRQRVKVWDAIVNAGFARVCLGSEESGKVTRYLATAKLLSLRREWKLRFMFDLHLARNTDLIEPTANALVVLKSGKIDPTTGELLPVAERKKPVSILEHVEGIAQLGSDGEPDPQAIANGLAYFREIEDLVERINLRNLEHSWQAFRTDAETGRKFVFQPNPCLRQIHIGEFFRAVRLYSQGEFSGQNLSQDARRTMLIDRERVTELDFSGMATRMLYHLAGIDAKGDVYRPEQVMPKFYGVAKASSDKDKRDLVRDFIKRATNICWNVASQSKANSSVGKMLSEHENAVFLRGVIYSVEGCKTPSDIVDRIKQVHPALADRFFTEFGIELMRTDGSIMLQILNEFVAKAGKPALGIHDAIVCKASDADFARETMTTVYRRFCLFKPQIRRVY